MPGLLILNADDFGFSSSVNAAVVTARREGLLTSASLMVTGSAADEAVSIARDDPALAVGLHLTLTEAQPAMLAAFDRGPARAGFRFFFDKAHRQALASEIEAQFAAFAKTGLRMSHVDGHQHMHAHPSVLPVVLRHAASYGACGIRVPRDIPIAAFRLDRSCLAFRACAALGSAYLTRVCDRMLAGSSLARCDYSIGSAMSGRMSERFARDVLGRVRCDSVELFFHPSTQACEAGFGPNRGDLDTLVSPRFRSLIEGGRWQPAVYADVERRRKEAAHERG